MPVGLSLSIVLSLLGQSPITLQDFIKSNGKKTCPTPMAEAQYRKLSPHQQLRQATLELCSAKKGTKPFQEALKRFDQLPFEKIFEEQMSFARDALSIQYLKTGDLDYELYALKRNPDGAYGDGYDLALIKRMVRRENPKIAPSAKARKILAIIDGRMGSLREEIVPEIATYLKKQSKTAFVKALLKHYGV